MKTILFVCTANICRSPMAAAIMRRRIAEMGLENQVQVLSAGVWAHAGNRASKNATAVLAERGMDLSTHFSQPVTPALLAATDLVLVMEESHRRSIFYLAPQYLAKVYLLSEMANQHDEVSDPFGGPLEGYVETADLLESMVDAGLPKILKRLGLSS